MWILNLLLFFVLLAGGFAGSQPWFTLHRLNKTNVLNGALFVLIFSRSSIAQSPGMPYPVFVLSGLVVWNLFYHAVSHAAEGMISNAAIIKKIYFPRLVIPLSAMISALIDFIIGFVLLLVCCMIYGQSVQWTALLFFPLAIGLVLVAAFGLGTWLGALNVKFRDFRYALPFLLQFLFFGTQVLYPAKWPCCIVKRYSSYCG